MKKKQRTPKGPVTRERLENAVTFMAWVVLEYGDVYAPIFYRLKAELEAWKCPREEAEKFLQDRLAEGKPPHLPKSSKHVWDTKP